mgnify:CR=1 FL=1
MFVSISLFFVYVLLGFLVHYFEVREGYSSQLLFVFCVPHVNRVGDERDQDRVPRYVYVRNVRIGRLSLCMELCVYVDIVVVLILVYCTVVM